MIRNRSVVLAIVMAVGAFAAFWLTEPSNRPPPADLVLRGGRIVTLDDKLPEAQALAVREDKIVAGGSNADVIDYIGPSTQVIEIGGQFAMPGFIEGHGHFTGIGENKINLDLINTTSWDEIVQIVARAVEKAKPGQWIIG